MEEIKGLVDLLASGGLPAILAISLWVNYMFYKEIRLNERERRVETKADNDKAWAALMAGAEAQKETTSAMRQLKEVIETAILKGGRT